MRILHLRNSIMRKVTGVGGGAEGVVDGGGEVVLVAGLKFCIDDGIWLVN